MVGVVFGVVVVVVVEGYLIVASKNSGLKLSLWVCFKVLGDYWADIAC